MCNRFYSMGVFKYCSYFGATKTHSFKYFKTDISALLYV